MNFNAVEICFLLFLIRSLNIVHLLWEIMLLKIEEFSFVICGMSA